MDRLAKEIKKSEQEVILIHGAGSFGHIYAKKYNLNEGYQNSEQIQGFSLTQLNTQYLNTLVLKSLQKNGIPAISISPHTILKLNDHKIHKINYEIFEDYLKNNFTPVSYGNVVLDNKKGFSICSGDLIIKLLSKYFKPEKIIFLIDEDGIYTSNPKIDKNAKFINNITPFELKKLSTTLDDHPDVTKGMKGKIETIIDMAELKIDVVLLNGNKEEMLYNVLIGKDTKSTIVSGGN
jgi:isopentenyl phosphate kinase